MTAETFFLILSPWLRFRFPLGYASGFPFGYASGFRLATPQNDNVE
jgi:hypothetical protein